MSLTGFISYKRVGWTGQTPWNPTNLNIMDKGIKDNNDMIANLRSEVSALNSKLNNYREYTIKLNTLEWERSGMSDMGLYYAYFQPNLDKILYAIKLEWSHLKDTQMIDLNIEQSNKLTLTSANIDFNEQATVKVRVFY